MGLITEGIVSIERAMDDTDEGLMADLHKCVSPSTRSLLLLLRTLHAINCNYASLIDFLAAVEEERETDTKNGLIMFYPLHESEFIRCAHHPPTGAGGGCWGLGIVHRKDDASGGEGEQWMGGRPAKEKRMGPVPSARPFGLLLQTSPAKHLLPFWQVAVAEEMLRRCTGA